MRSSQLIDTPAAGAEHGTLYAAFELSKAKWLVGLVVSGERKMSQHTISGGDTAAVWQLISKKRDQAENKQGRPVRVVSCYEAGYDGFWFDRWLAEQGVVNRVLDPSSIEMPRRARQAKTDRLDLERLMRVLIRHEGGEPKVCSVVHPPTPEQEDARRVTRERERLIGERTAHTNRIKGLLHGQGIRDAHPRCKGFLEELAQLRTGDGRAVPANLAAEITREHARLEQICKQIAEVEGQMKAERAAAAPDSRASKVNHLIDLKSLGPVGGETLVNEVFWRDFQNRRQVGGYFGLAGTPFDSGQSSREQGISKSGNARARTLAIELSWLWLRHQPDSALSLWFKERVGDQKGRVKRIAIVALARKLMVALWRFLSQGLVPEGAITRAAAPAGRRAGRPGVLRREPMMTVLTHGPCGTAVSEGSHRFLGKTSTVHEGLGCGAPRRPTGYKVMPSTRRALAKCPTSRRCTPKAASRRSHSSAVLAASRPLRAASGGGLRPALTPLARGALRLPSSRLPND